MTSEGGRTQILSKFKIISNIWVVNGWLNLTNMYNNKQQYLTNNYQLYNCTNTDKIMYLYRKNIASFYSVYLGFGSRKYFLRIILWHHHSLYSVWWHHPNSKNVKKICDVDDDKNLVTITVPLKVVVGLWQFPAHHHISLQYRLPLLKL